MDLAELIKEKIKNIEEEDSKVDKELGDLRSERGTLIDARSTARQEENQQEVDRLDGEIEDVDKKIDPLDERSGALCDEKEVLKFLVETLNKVDGIQDMIKPYLPAIEGYLTSKGADLASIIGAFVSICLGITEGLEPQLDKFSGLRAKKLFRDFKKMEEAGFSTDQAFTLIVASISPGGVLGMLKNLPSLNIKTG